MSSCNRLCLTCASRPRARLPLLLVAAILIGGPALKAGPKPNPLCGSSPQPDWRALVNRRYGFCLWYPPAYSLQARPLSPGRTGIHSLATLLSTVPRKAAIHDTAGASIEVWRLPSHFDLQRLTSDAPTGVIDPPTPMHFGANTFYYYGAGGGGVAYPDRYYFNLHGVTLELLFFGPFEGKSPDEQTQAMEQLLLSSFHAAP